MCIYAYMYVCICICISPTTPSSLPNPQVHNRMWVTYRMWVDKRVAGRQGNVGIFHNFVIACPSL